MYLRILGVVLLALGVFSVFLGLRLMWSLPKLLRTPIRRPSSLSPRDGFVVCRGHATEYADTVSAPFTGTECLGYTYTVAERYPSLAALPGLYTPLKSGARAIPFSLEGKQGSIEVEPSGRRFSLDTNRTVFSVSAGGDPPTRIREFFGDSEQLPPSPGWVQYIPFLGVRRFTECRVDPGEEYVIAGTVENRDGTVVIGGSIIVSTGSMTSSGMSRFLRGLIPLVSGIVLIAAGGWLILV